jgi:hypothetical protein
VGRWDQNGSKGDWLRGCGLDSTGSGQGPVAGCCECGDEPSGSCATELVSYAFTSFKRYYMLQITSSVGQLHHVACLLRKLLKQ